MYEAVMIAAMGLNSQQRRIDTIAGNVSNINTTSYKSARLDFKDALYTAGIVPAAPRTPDGNQQKGHGTMVSAITKEFTQGSILITDNELDAAIDGEGFFTLNDGNGNTVYTRNGAFTISNNEDGTVFLVNQSGYYVLDENEERIEIPGNTAKIQISEDGTVSFCDGTGEAMSQVKLGVFSFRNLMGIESAGNGNYIETGSSGERFVPEDSIIRQGAVEGSNVDLSTEMTRLIRTQRIFSLASKALTTADDMEGIANNLRK